MHGAIEVPLPLGENLQTFVVANADEVADADQLSTAVIRQNDNMQKPVYISEIIGFTSDNSVKSLDVELKRLVGLCLPRWSRRRKWMALLNLMHWT